MAGTALLRSVATKMRGMTAPRGPHCVGRRPFTPSSRPSAADNTDPSQNKNAPGQLHSAKQSTPITTPTKVLCLAFVGTTAFFYFWFKPRLEAFSEELIALRRERSILIEAVEECQRTHIKATDDPSQAQVTQASGQGKESGGRPC